MKQGFHAFTIPQTSPERHWTHAKTVKRFTGFRLDNMAIL